MARRGRHSDDGGQSFDSLLDTMTNVVGILVIVLVVTLLGVRDAVRRIEWEIPDISEAKLQEYRDLANVKEQKLDVNKASIEELQAVLAKLRQLEQEIAELRKALALDTPEEQIAEYRKRLEELLKQKQKLEEETEKNKDQVERLRKRIASLPQSNPSATKVIRMPRPRSAPPGSTCVWFICRNNRIGRLDQEALLKEAQRRIASSKYLLAVRERGRIKKVSSGKRKRHSILREAANWVLDPKKLEEYFTRKNIGDRDFRLSLELHPTLRTERLVATLRKEAGEDVEKLSSSISRYKTVVRNLDKNKQYARFVVWPDSFEVYVKAREIIEKEGIPAGWLFYTGEGWQVAWDFGLNVAGEKKPEPVKAKPKPPPAPGEKPKKPVAPVAILD